MKMPFGKHKGQQLGEIPRNYLQWLLTLDDLQPALRSEAQRVLHGIGAATTNTTKASTSTGQRIQDDPDHDLAEMLADAQEVIDRQNNRLFELELELIQLRHGATPAVADKVVKGWYRELSMKYHPDRGGSNDAQAIVNDAYERLVKALAG